VTDVRAVRSGGEFWRKQDR